MAMEKLKVLEQPGGPMMMSGIMAEQHTTIDQRFSSRALVQAMPGGIFVLSYKCFIVVLSISSKLF